MPLELPAEVYLFSDGVFDTRRHEEERPLDQLIEFLVAPGEGKSVPEIRERALGHLHGAPPPDDCSVLKVTFLPMMECRGMDSAQAAGAMPPPMRFAASMETATP